MIILVAANPNSLVLRTNQPTPSQKSITAIDAQRLVWAATFFTAAVLFHNADHTRRGVDSVSRDVFWIGTSAILLEVGVVVLACQRHRLAALAATAAGFSLALGYVVVHFLPERGWLSDPLASGVGVTPVSWIAASVEVVAALTLGIAGLVTIRRRRGLAVSGSGPGPEQRTLLQTFRHPVVLAMIAGNVILLTITAIQY